MGNDNSVTINAKTLAEITQPIKEIFNKLNKEVKENLVNLLSKRVQPKDWYGIEKTYSYSARDDVLNNKESFKITFYPNGTCSALEIKSESKEDYDDNFGFGIFFATEKGVNVQTLTLAHTKGWAFKHELSEIVDSKEYYFARRQVVEELVSYSELINNKNGPYVLVPSD